MNAIEIQWYEGCALEKHLAANLSFWIALTDTLGCKNKGAAKRFLLLGHVKIALESTGP